MGFFKPLQLLVRSAGVAGAILLSGSISATASDGNAVPYVQSVGDGFDFSSGSWREALLIDRFMEPGAFNIMGKAFARDSAVATQVYLLRTGEALYFGIICHDGDGMARKGSGPQKTEFPAGNTFELFIDGDLNEQQAYYQFVVNPSGQQWFARAGVVRPVEGVECRVQQEEKAWKVRLRIPYREIGIGSDCEEVYVNFFRNYVSTVAGEGAKFSTWEGAAIATFNTLRPLTFLPAETP